MACPLTLSYFLIDALLNAVTNQVAFTSPTTLYVGLFTSNPNPDNSGTEVSTSGTGYVRQAVTWSPVVSHQTDNAEVITFPISTSPWGTITYVALFDAVSAGNLLAFTLATTVVTLGTGNIYQFNPNTLILSFQ